MSLFPEPYKRVEKAPDDLGVLCLRTMQLFRLSEGLEYTNLGRMLADRIDRIFRQVGQGLVG